MPSDLGLAAALATFLGIDVPTAGYYLGIATVMVTFVALAWILKDQISGSGIFIPTAFAVVIVVLIGWWPPWTIVFIVLIIAFIITDPFGEAGGVG